MMDMMEKIERLRQKTDLSYEEAKAALEAAGGDLLDAMILLERQGKVKQPAQSSYSTAYEEQNCYVRVQDKVEEQEKSAPDFRRSVKRIFGICTRFIKQTSFVVTKGGNSLFTMPTLVFVILLFMFWEAVFPVMIVALFCGIRYSFRGAENADAANRVLDQAGSIVDDVKEGFMNGFESNDRSA